RQGKSGHDGVGHQGRVQDLGELDQPAAVAETAGEVGRNPDRQARLADSARPDQADQAGLGELPPDVGDLAAAADEAGCLGGQVARAPGGPGHVDPGGNPRTPGPGGRVGPGVTPGTPGPGGRVGPGGTPGTPRPEGFAPPSPPAVCSGQPSARPRTPP